MASLRELRWFALGLASLAALLACGCETKQADGAKVEVRVLAAASLADAMREVGAAFEAEHPGVSVAFSFGGSNQLRTQLENGGPGDVFAAADRNQMDAAIESKVVDATTVRVFAHNRLAVLIPMENRAKIEKLSDLAHPGLKVVVADQAVPVGNYTRLMLEKAGSVTEFGPGFVKGIEANIVSHEENAAAVVTKVSLNEVDAGIGYASDAESSGDRKVLAIALPRALQQEVDYVAAVTTRSRDAANARAFAEFLASSSASAILSRRGFVRPDAGVP